MSDRITLEECLEQINKVLRSSLYTSHSISLIQFRDRLQAQVEADQSCVVFTLVRFALQGRRKQEPERWDTIGEFQTEEEARKDEEDYKNWQATHENTGWLGFRVVKETTVKTICEEKAQVEAEQKQTPRYDEAGLIAGLKEAWLAMDKVEGYDALDEWQDKWWEFLWNEPEKAEGAGR